MMMYIWRVAEFWFDHLHRFIVQFKVTAIVGAVGQTLGIPLSPDIKRYCSLALGRMEYANTDLPDLV